MRYVLDFGSANAGGSPAFTLFVRLDTLAALPQPTITEIGAGQYYFDVDWTATTATSLTFKASLAGVELSSTLSAPDVVVPGTASVSAGSISTAGYSTVGVIVARAGTQCGVLNLNPAQQSAYDPFASSDPNVVQFLELLSGLGDDLAAKVKRYRECSIVTAGGATSYALPADFAGMSDQTGWDRTSQFPLMGPVSSVFTAQLKSSTTGVVTQIPFRVEGNLLTFPVAPGNGLTVVFEYASSYWIQTAGSGTGPDSGHPTASGDFVLFDPLLVVRGLKLAFLQAKGRDTSTAFAEFFDRLELIKGRTSGGPRLSMSGRKTGSRFLDAMNAPDTGYGA